jgi:O-antigen ligase
MREERLAFGGGSASVRPVTVEVAGPRALPTVDATGAEGDDRAFTFLLLFTAVLFLRPQDILPPLEFLHLAESTAIAGLLALFFGRLSRRQPISRVTPELVAVLAFGGVILGTAPFSIWVSGSIGVFTELYAKVILIYLLAVNAVSSPRRLERMTWVLVLVVGYTGFRAMLDYVRGVNLIGHGTRVQGSVGGLMQNPNDLALNMVVFVPLAALFAFEGRTPLRRLIAAICALGMVGAVVASGSRGGFLGFATMLVVLAAGQLRRRPGLVLAGVLALMCALPILPDTYWRRIASITDHSKDDFGSADARETLMRESLQAYVQNPFVGVGAGEFKDWNPQKREQAWHESHNVWLQVAAELGTVGLAVFLFLVTRAVVAVYQTRRLLRRRRSGPSGRSRGVRRTAAPATDGVAWIDAHSTAMAASIAGWLVCAFFASVAYNWTFYYLLALAATPRDMLRAALPRPSQAAAPAAPPVLVLAGRREAQA